jgi:hypothetical protein
MYYQSSLLVFYTGVICFLRGSVLKKLGIGRLIDQLVRYNLLNNVAKTVHTCTNTLFSARPCVFCPHILLKRLRDRHPSTPRKIIAWPVDLRTNN